MKVGTDAVLLGAWASVENAERILDVGTGTGIIALMVAQRSDAHIDAIELDRDAFEQAVENIAKSEYAGRINVIHDDYKRFSISQDKTYELIVSNPPYFSNSLKSENPRKNIARHDTGLDLESFFECSIEILSERGIISLIIPTEKELYVLEIASKKQLKLVRSLEISSKPGAAPKRILMEFGNAYLGKETKARITIYESSQEYSSAFVALTRDFYMDF